MFLVGSCLVHARSFRVDQIPQGDEFRCLNCHFSPQGGAVNGFGYDVSLTLQSGNVNWRAVCELDSDGDGLSNGEELGDPNCMWLGGGINSDVVTNPGDPLSPLPEVPDMDVMDQAVIDMEIDMEIDMVLPDRDLWDAWLYDAWIEDAFQTQTTMPDLSIEDAMISVDQSNESDQILNSDQGVTMEGDAKMSGDIDQSQSTGSMENMEEDSDQMTVDGNSEMNENETSMQSQSTESDDSKASGCMHMPVDVSMFSSWFVFVVGFVMLRLFMIRLYRQS